MQISKGYCNSKEIMVHDVFFDNDECFKEVENIKKFKKCQRIKCKYYWECQETGGVVRKTDCKKNQSKWKLLYNFLTGGIAFVLTILIFSVLSLKIFNGIGLLTIFLVFLYILCSIFEMLVSKVLEKRFYKKLKRKKNKQEVVELRNYKEDKIAEVEVFIKELKKFYKNNNFGNNNEKVEKCIQKLWQIVRELKKNNEGYGSVAFLFEVYVPEFYNTLNYYSNLKKSKQVQEKHEEVLKRSVDDFLKFLENQKIYTGSMENKFETLAKMIDEGEE